MLFIKKSNGYANFMENLNNYKNSKKLLLMGVITVFYILVTLPKAKEFNQPQLTAFTNSSTDTTLNISVIKVEPSLQIENDTKRRLTRKLPVSHVFIVSAYFYPTSKSLGNNAIALNMVVDSKNFNVNNATYNVLGSNGTHQELSIATSQTEGFQYCRYIAAMARTNSVANLSNLEMESNGIKVSIPFKTARYTAPNPVIICISPQFVAEQWQIFLMHIHVANRFGGHMHIYVTSIVKSYFKLMKEYEKLGYLTVEPWLRMKFSHSETPFFEPNLNTELRNQAGALTDCLLQYKEAADYVAFFDLDDILVPLNYPTYLEEFNAEWFKHKNSTSIAYGRREHEFVKVEAFSEFSFQKLVSSLRSSDSVKAGKVVVKPEFHNSTWLHVSLHEDRSTRYNVRTPRLIHVQRPIQKTGNNEIKKLWKFQFQKFNETIKSEDIQEIEKDIWSVRNLTAVAEISYSLPKRDFYFPIVFKCYLSEFYNKPIIDKCPNAEMCKLPQREDIECVHSDAEYFSGPHMKPFTFHYAKNAFWSENYGCYQ
ncbi:hypothetical protein GCK72_013808 [Caenorhabditis remanei]|uniref:Glycosyltransferase family 92 protein n=1 Tax=Caenorhabditis remanei TaxID=31234 RepID=A0A6A5GS49_CAERE|nr:hypothetical protein GCK72_013808 [Caenorhabditis remanei]KAF1757353.1 hypothetical protein GCK72_013808 [Caenorhabditis remanei]